MTMGKFYKYLNCQGQGGGGGGIPPGETITSMISHSGVELIRARAGRCRLQTSYVSVSTKLQTTLYYGFRPTCPLLRRLDDQKCLSKELDVLPLLGASRAEIVRKYYSIFL